MTITATIARQCTLEIVGASGAPVVAVLGGISSSRHVTSTTGNLSSGWWNEVVGPGRVIDTNSFLVVGVDYLDDSGGGSISTHDQAVAVHSALSEAGIGRLHALVGASYGGMVGLAFAATFPLSIERLVVIGAAHESAPAATMHRLLQRQVLELGRRAGLETEALVIARGMATTTYTSTDAVSRDFEAADAEERLDAIERVLVAAGETFAGRCSPDRFQSLSKSLDLHSVDPAAITCATTLIGVNQDLLVPATQLRDLAGRIGSNCTLKLVDSIYGHDAFLRDHCVLTPIVRNALTTEVAES